MRASATTPWIVLGCIAAFAALRAYGQGLTSFAYPSRIRRIAEAIAFAEGFQVSGSLAQQNHNPGNLTRLDGSFQVYASNEYGWSALYDYVDRMLSGLGLYPSGISIQEAARIYTATEQSAWANNVASYLGVNVYTPLEAV